MIKKLQLNTNPIGILIGFILAISQFSCNTYSREELIDNGYKMKEKYVPRLDSLVEIANHISKKECVNYQINISRSQDYFSFESVYRDINNKVIRLENFNCSNEFKDSIRSIIPKDEITGFDFIQDLYVNFSLDFHRDKNLKHAGLIYCFDKNKFFRVFPKMLEVGKNNQEGYSGSDWIYFYDDHWAISIGSTIKEISINDCEEILNE